MGPNFALNASTIIVNSSVATDVSGPVEYQFENVTNGTLSAWSIDTAWTNDTGVDTDPPPDLGLCANLERDLGEVV